MFAKYLELVMPSLQAVACVRDLVSAAILVLFSALAYVARFWIFNKGKKKVLKIVWQ